MLRISILRGHHETSRIIGPIVQRIDVEGAPQGNPRRRRLHPRSASPSRTHHHPVTSTSAVRSSSREDDPTPELGAEPRGTMRTTYAQPRRRNARCTRRRRSVRRAAQHALLCTAGRYPARKAATVDCGVNTVAVPRCLANRAP